MKLIFGLFITLFSLESSAMSFDFVNQRCHPLPGKNLPKESDINAVEGCIHRHIPASLRQFYLEAGNRQIPGYDMAYIYGGARSSLAQLQLKSRQEGIPDTHFAFATDNSETIFCIDIESQKIHAYNLSDQQLTNEFWEDLEHFIKSILTPGREI